MMLTREPSIHLFHDKDHNLENFTVVWLDADIDKTDDCHDTKKRLRTTANHLRTFCDADECIDYISSIKIEQALLILSGSFGEIIAPLIFELPQITFIYIFCLNKIKHETWANHQLNNHNKIRGVFIHKDSLLIQIAEDAKVLSKHMMPMNVFSLSHNEKSIRDLDKESTVFMWNQLLMDVLLRMPKSDESKTELLTECESYYRDNDKELEKINDFRLNYSSDAALSWYTRDSFVYRLLNKALRTRDIDIIFKFRFFIADLYRQLQKEHSKFMESCTNGECFLTVYRGQHLKADELQELKDNVGRLISMNTFISTTYKKDVASLLAGDGSLSPILESILFEIRINTNIDTKPYANIKELSFIKDEDEVLFSIGTIFRIESVEKQTETKIWDVKLILNSDDDEQMKVLSKQISEEADGGSDLNMLGFLLIQIGEYAKAERYFRRLINNTLPNDPDMDMLYNNIGAVYNDQGEYSQALTCYQQALEIRLKALGPNHPTVATTYNNIGAVYNDQGEYSQALTYYQKALEIQLNTLGSDHPTVATTYNNIGLVYKYQGEYFQALIYYQQALEILLKTLGPNHPTVATTYNNIGEVYNHQAQYSQALTYYQKALEIEWKTLGPNHPAVATTYNNIGAVYNDQGEYPQALIYYQQALEILLKTLGSNHPTVATAYNNIGGVYNHQRKYSQALTYYQKTLEIQLNTLGPDHPTVATTYNNIGLVYKYQAEYFQALTYYQQALEILLKTLGPNHPTVATTYNNIGLVYKYQDEYSQALTCYQQALEILLKTLGSNHLTVATTYNNIGLVYKYQGEYSQALTYYQQALEILLKTLGPNHPTVATTYNNIGEIYNDQGEYSQALTYYQKTLEIQLNTLGSDHPTVATTYNNIGLVYKYQAEYFQALTYYQQALEILLKTLGPNHPTVATTYNNIGEVYNHQAQYSQDFAIEPSKCRENVQQHW
ncbi:unnamed protein product [Didymodactylos carnosus]|uniref:NAD(P)(+)--arginine ADP-ribosyltransferase n=1 Tax=Didymodactylos carnosus TaxID=1234261 RepID=A0A8S2REE5_9BILA|nr:unnamed protein product [Didymodactylos carnosus]